MFNLLTGDSQQNLAVPTAPHKSSARRHLSASVERVRDAIHRIPRPHISSSRTSLNSKKKRNSVISNASTVNDEDTVSIMVPDKQNRSGMYHSFRCIRRGLVVRISAFHAGGPGSIPGVGTLIFYPKNIIHNAKYLLFGFK